MADYDPPYASEAERQLAWAIVKHLRPDAKLIKQPNFGTLCGQLATEFLLETPEPGAIRIALDISSLSTKKHSLAEARDAILLGARTVDAVVLIAPRHAMDHLEDALFLLSQWYPGIFTERGLANLRILASDSAKKDSETGPLDSVIDYSGGEALVLERRCRENPDGISKQFWQDLYNFAVVAKPRDLRTLMSRFTNGSRWRFVSPEERSV